MDPRAFELFLDLHAGLPRQGPGSPEATARAWRALPDLPASPTVLDAGCGPGAQALELARLGAGRVLAVDRHAPFLEELRVRAAAAGLADRIEARHGDLARLDLPPGSFDLLWSEGALYAVGFEEGLRALRPLLRPGGLAAVTEATWFRPAPPEEVRGFWAREYPAMLDVAGSRARAEAAGYEVLSTFPLPEACWWRYYRPLEARLDAWLADHPGDALAAAVVAAERAEIAICARYADWYGYTFHLLRRA